MASYRPLVLYKHGGHILHPKLTYGLPPGMGKKMVEFGIFEKVEAPADVDLSGMDWDEGTQLYNPSHKIIPDPIDHPQDI